MRTRAVESVPRQSVQPHVRWDLKRRPNGTQMFDNLMSRVSAFERSQRAQGQTLSDSRGHVSQLKHDFDATVTDIEEFKTWVVGCLTAIGTIAERKFNETDASVTVAQNKFIDADARSIRLEDAVNRTVPSRGVLRSTLRSQHDSTSQIKYVDSGNAATARNVRRCEST